MSSISEAEKTMAEYKLCSFLVSLVIIISSCPSHSLAAPTYRYPRFLGKFSGQTKSHPQIQPQYETQYFEQRLDHFSFADLPKFRQRYLINTKHWVGAQRLGPIFFYCGNEGDIVWFATNSGFIWEIAPQFGAMLVFPEHRYYGESVPFGSKEEAYKNATTLSYLTAEQALADFAVLLTELKQNFSCKECPVVLFGGSYGGSDRPIVLFASEIIDDSTLNSCFPLKKSKTVLAAWMRLKYPHIAIGALASSAPILQFEDIVPPETFYDIVSNGFRRESSSCFNYIKQSWSELKSKGHATDGLEQLTKTFHFCRQLKRSENLSDWLESAYSYLAMVNYPYPADFMMPLPAHPIREVCKRIDDCPAGTSILERIYEGVNVYYNYTGEAKCFELDDDPHGLSGWNWQACTEMVMPMSSSEESSMFPTYDFNYSSFQEECLRDYGVTPRPKWITTEFGGHDIHVALKKFGSNIIFSNGLLDPWSGGSVLQNISESVVSLVTEEGAHHIDLRAAGPDDPDWLVEQRATEVKLIEGWINDYYKQKNAAYSM